MSKGVHTVDSVPLGLTMIRGVFGGTIAPEIEKNMATFNKDLVSPVERGFVNDTAANLAIQRSGVEEKVTNLLSFSEDCSTQNRWEHAANVKIVAPGVAEVDLLHILRDLGACIAIPMMYGQGLLDHNPSLLSDFWQFDNVAFPLLMLGMPTWAPLPAFQRALAARRRIQRALSVLYTHLNQRLDGEAVDLDADTADVSTIIQERNRMFAKWGVSVPDRGVLELGNFWGQNANTQPLVFWFILYIYSTPGLLQALRAETAPHVTCSTANPVRIEHIDVAAVGRGCPLFKAALLETFRMANNPTSIRYVHKSVAISDSVGEQMLQPGTWLSAPHGAMQQDPAIFSDPDVFTPDRFLEENSATGERVPRYGRMRPWGAGAGICKGRTFAENEILAIAACFMTAWDMDPADGEGWKIPKMVPGTGVKQPSSPVRVRIRRRQI